MNSNSLPSQGLSIHFNDKVASTYVSDLNLPKVLNKIINYFLYCFFFLRLFSSLHALLSFQSLCRHVVFAWIISLFTEVKLMNWQLLFIKFLVVDMWLWFHPCGMHFRNLGILVGPIHLKFGCKSLHKGLVKVKLNWYHHLYVVNMTSMKESDVNTAMGKSFIGTFTCKFKCHRAKREKKRFLCVFWWNFTYAAIWHHMSNEHDNSGRKRRWHQLTFLLSLMRTLLNIRNQSAHGNRVHSLS